MNDLLRLINKGAVAEVIDIVLGLDDDARQEAADALVPFMRSEAGRWWWEGDTPALAAATVGLVPTAAKAARILGREGVPLPFKAVDPVLRVARARGITWLAELAHRLEPPRDNWAFSAGLLRAEQAPPPETAGFLTGWLGELDFPAVPRERSVPMVDRLRADPFLPALLPKIFEVDGLGTRLPPDFAEAVAQLCSEGVIGRATLLDSTLDRLLRGDRPGSLRAFVKLHECLTPTPTEVGARSGEYFRLLADAPVKVATMAQKALLAADVDLRSMLDVSQAVLTRPEKTLVRKQMAWLGKLDRSPAVASVIAIARDHPAPEVRDRAVALAGLPPAGVVVHPRGDHLPAPSRPTPAPPPISDVDELREEVTLLLRDLSRGPLERVLDGVVRFSITDPETMARALKPLVTTGNEEWLFGRDGWDPLCLCPAIGGVLRVATGSSGAERTRWIGKLAEAVRPQDHPLQGRGSVPPPHRLLLLRLAELPVLLGYGGSQPLDTTGLTLPAGGGAVGYHGLLSTPTSSTGALEPTELYERLAALGDRPPWRWDLTQAFLRVAPGPDDALANRAEALGTAAGAALATRLRSGGLPQPVQHEVLVDRRPDRSRHFWPDTGYWRDSAWEAQPPHRLLIRTEAPPGADPGATALLTGNLGTTETDFQAWTSYWPALLPHHRGLIAAAALPQIAAAADTDSKEGAAILPLLAERSGDGGAALLLAVAYGLGARHPQDRVSSLDAFLELAAAGTLDPTAVGGFLGRLAVLDVLKPTRAVEPLRDAATAGAPLTVWRLLSAALPALLKAPQPPRGTPDLLSLAAETAAATGVRLEVDGLAAVAARPGGTRLVTEARRLAGANT